MSGMLTVSGYSAAGEGVRDEGKERPNRVQHAAAILKADESPLAPNLANTITMTFDALFYILTFQLSFSVNLNSSGC